MHVVTGHSGNQVSYNEKPENAFACTKLDLPERVPMKIGAREAMTTVAVNEPTKGGEASSSATDKGDKNSSISSPASRAPNAFQGSLYALALAFTSTSLIM